MKKYIKPEISDEEIEIEDIMEGSGLSDNIEDEYDEASGDRTLFPW